MKLKTVGVIGEYDATQKAKEIAYEVGFNIAKKGYVLICGGLSGVMEEACRGAKDAGGLTIGIIPQTERNFANPYVDIPIVTGIGEARNLIVVRSSMAVIAIEGGYGTLSEIAFALKANIPIIGINTWNLTKQRYENVPIIRVKDAKEAIERLEEILKCVE